VKGCLGDLSWLLNVGAFYCKTLTILTSLCSLSWSVSYSSVRKTVNHIDLRNRLNIRQYQLPYTPVKAKHLRAYMHICILAKELEQHCINFHAYHVYIMWVGDHFLCDSLVCEKGCKNLLLCILYVYMYDFLCLPFLFIYVWLFKLAHGSRFRIWQRPFILWTTILDYVTVA